MRLLAVFSQTDGFEAVQEACDVLGTDKSLTSAFAGAEFSRVEFCVEGGTTD
jgi:hypothetical protein